MIIYRKHYTKFTDDTETVINVVGIHSLSMYIISNIYLSKCTYKLFISCIYLFISYKLDIIRVPSTSSVSSSVSGCMAMLSGESINKNGGYDPIGFESTTGLSPKALKSIRERMALGLERMKELEEKVKVIPTLQVSIYTIKFSRPNQNFRLYYINNLELN